jgi:NTP pyrophosphatase (non-canonical NTP hydrolase)
MTTPWVIIPSTPTPEDQNPQGTPIRYDVFVAKLFKYQTQSMMQMHAALGLCEEAGELAGCIKKHAVYNKRLADPMKEDGLPLEVHILEEAGDVLFYLQAVLNQFDMDFQEVLQYNACKLATRFRDMEYSDTAANARSDKPALPKEEGKEAS